MTFGRGILVISSGWFAAPLSQCPWTCVAGRTVAGMLDCQPGLSLKGHLGYMLHLVCWHIACKTSKQFFEEDIEHVRTYACERRHVILCQTAAGSQLLLCRSDIPNQTSPSQKFAELNCICIYQHFDAGSHSNNCRRVTRYGPASRSRHTGDCLHSQRWGLDLLGVLDAFNFCCISFYFHCYALPAMSIILRLL
jgi:hypothetical protein